MKNFPSSILVLLAGIITLVGCQPREEIYSTTYSRSNYFKPESDEVTSGYNRDFNAPRQVAEADSDAPESENIGKDPDAADQGLPKLASLE